MFERFNFRERTGEIAQEDEPVTETPSEREGYSVTLDTRQVIFLISGYVFLCVLVFTLGVVVGRAISQSTPASDASALPPNLLGERPVAARQEIVTGSYIPRISEVQPKHQATQEPDPRVSPPPPPSAILDKGASAEVTTQRTTPPIAQEVARPSELTTVVSRPAEKREREVRRADIVEKKPIETTVPHPSPSHPGDYTIQVSSFRSFEQASELKDRLSQKGYGAYVQSVDLSDKGMWHRVRVGNFRDKNGAERMASGIRTRESLPVLVTKKGQ